MNKTFKYAAIRKEVESIKRALAELSEGNYQHFAYLIERIDRIEDLDPKLAADLAAAAWLAVN